MAPCARHTHQPSNRPTVQPTTISFAPCILNLVDWRSFSLAGNNWRSCNRVRLNNFQSRDSPWSLLASLFRFYFFFFGDKIVLRVHSRFGRHVTLFYSLPAFNVISPGHAMQFSFACQFLFRESTSIAHTHTGEWMECVTEPFCVASPGAIEWKKNKRLNHKRHSKSINGNTHSTAYVYHVDQEA